MKVQLQEGQRLGARVEGFDHRTASDEDVRRLIDLTHERKIVVLRGQQLGPQDYLALGQRFGEVEAYYQPMYHHPEVKEIFVASNIAQDGKVVGVPRTGKFWHIDYEFMPRPFAFTLVYQRVVPQGPRGTFYIDLAEAFDKLPQALKDEARGTIACHSPRRYFKIRPEDVYRPICELLEEIDRETPPARHPTVIRHPVTGRETLFISEGLTYALEGPGGEELRPGLLRSLLEASGQMDAEHRHPAIHLQTVETNDLVMWDNRALVHCALHTPTPEPTETWRLTLNDGLPLSLGA